MTLQTIAADARFDGILSKSAAEKAASYIAALEELYVIEGVGGWDAPIRSRSRLRVKPKYYFADPSLAANLLNVTPERLVGDGQLFGILFEALCMHDLAVYASVLPGAGPEPLHYYRDSDGLEADAVIELADGRWAAFEIKLGENKANEAAASLRRLKDKVSANPAARNPAPEFMAVIVGAGEYARFDRERGFTSCRSLRWVRKCEYRNLSFSYEYVSIWYYKDAPDFQDVFLKPNQPHNHAS